MSATSPILPILSLAGSTFSNADGYKLLLALREALATQPGPVTLDLTGVVSFSSSFLNSSLGALYEELGAVGYKRLRLSNFKPAQLKQLKDYMTEVAQYHADK